LFPFLLERDRGEEVEEGKELRDSFPLKRIKITRGGTKRERKKRGNYLKVQCGKRGKVTGTTPAARLSRF